MDIAKLLLDAKDAGLRFWLDKGTLHYRVVGEGEVNDHLESVRSHKQEVVSFLDGMGGVVRNRTPLRPEPRPDTIPLSYVQERLWFLEQIGLTGNAFAIGFVLSLRGLLNIPALQSSLHALISRHEILRTRFETRDGSPCQVIATEPDAGALQVIEWDLPDTPERHERLMRAIQQELERPFDLQRGPLLRAKLWRLTPEDHALVLAAHHLIFDAWSFGVFARELSELYASATEGRMAQLAPLPLQYADYSIWQRKRLAEGEMDEQLAYWRQQLTDIKPLLLPTDRPRPPVWRSNGAIELYTFPEELASSMRALAKTHGLTLYMVLLAGLQVLLSRWSGSRDIAVGTHVAGRTHPDTEALIGYFANALVLRARIEPRESVLWMLQRAKATTLDANAHQDVPLEKILAELRPDRDLSRQPLFQVSLALTNVPEEALRLPGLVISSPGRSEYNTTKLDLALVLQETAAGLFGHLEYSTDLFDRSTVQRLLRAYEYLLEQMVQVPTRGLCELELLRAAEREEIVSGLNRTRCALEGSPYVDEWIAAQARRTPDAPAVLDEGSTLTYRALEAQAHTLARYLASRGIKPGQLVGICMERSVEMVVGLLGILKAGAAFVPLDPGYPCDRIAYMLEDAAPGVLLIQERLRDLLPAGGLRVVALDTDWERIEQASSGGGAPLALRRPQDPAYVLYTSGSTGQPKGAMNEHRGLINHLQWMQRTYPLGEQDCMLQKTPFSFDVSVSEFFWPLMAGARLVMARPHGHRDPQYLLKIIEDAGVTVLHFVPSMLQMLLNQHQPMQCPTVRHVVCIGEELSAGLQRRFLEQLPLAQLHNLYGPTEAAIAITAWDCQRNDQSPCVPIGYPIANTRLYVLDPFLHPVPIGVGGELHIAGLALGSGYLNRPDLTADCFIPDPFSPDAAARMYRTGDLGRWRADGSLEFLGRRDHQIKLRGFRIEPGEIEARLCTHPTVKEALVRLREDSPGDARLVAYVSGTPEVNVDDLREHLGQSLPTYMVPAAIVLLAEWPRLANGKVDRTRLPAPDGQAYARTAYEPPAGETEEQLAAIWRQVLNVERVGRHDSFFDLGGHSLLALQLISRVREVLRADVPLRVLFQSTTLAALAVAVDEAPALETDTALPLSALEAGVGRYEPFPLTDTQEAYWIGQFEGFELGNVSSHMYFEVDMPGIDLARLHDAWHRVIERHDALRIVLTEDGRQRVQRDIRAYEIVTHELSQLSPGEVEKHLSATRERLCRRKSEPDRWPLFGIEVSVLRNNNVRLHIAIDELICDAWSLGILQRDLAFMYRGEGANLSSLPLSFRDCVLEEQRRRNSPQHTRARAYWDALMADMPPAPSLPIAVSPARISQPHAASLSRVISPSDFRALKEHAARWSITPSAILLSLYADVLRRFCAQKHFTVNVTVLDRPSVHETVHEIVGNFVSMLPLIVDLRSRIPSFLERVRAVQSTLWESIDHRMVSGVEIMRQHARQLGGHRGALLPIVFTSTLGFDDVLGRRSNDLAAGPLSQGNLSYSVHQSPQVWLNLGITEAEGGLKHSWNHVRELFPEGLVQSMMEAFHTRLLALARNAQDWQDPTSWWPAERAVSPATIQECDPPVRLEEMFLRQLPASASHPAVITPSIVMTYAELEARSRTVALRVRELTRGHPDAVVAVVMERGWEQVAAVLGVLRAGATYTPIDPTLPRERFHYLLSASGANAALTQSWLDADIPWPANIPRMAVDTAGVGNDQPLQGLARQTPDQMAYITFTSGSSGLPKGVAISHRSAANTLLSINRIAAVTAADRMLGVASLSFDLSVYDIFGMLAAGGALVLPASSEHADPTHWAQMMERGGVTLWNSVPAHLQLLLECREKPTRPLLRFIMLSGDWIPLGLPAQARMAFGASTQILAMGGATEAAIWSIGKWVEEIQPGWTSIPYGRPLAGQDVLVLDDDLEVCPAWATGELHIAGEGVALGYWRDPERTAQQFIPHPRTGQRLYRTGDLGRYRSDGEIELLGRVDTQVKISGYRVDLGEVEFALLQCPDVREAAVVAREAKGAAPVLIAYVVLREGTDIGADDLREFLRQKIPAYAIPRQLYPLEKLPLTSNGKIDRKTLAQRQIDQPARTYCAPRFSLEHTLVKLWGEVLSPQGDIGIHDNFFEVGGDSILATQLAARIQEQFALSWPLRVIFEVPHVAGQAQRIMRDTMESTDSRVLAEALDAAEADSGATVSP